MEFADQYLNKLAHGDLRGAIFSEASLGRILDATYSLSNSSNLSVSPPFAPVFEEFEIGRIITYQSRISGGWHTTAKPDDHVSAAFQANFPAHPSAPLAVDALWSGFINADASVSSGRIKGVTSRPVDLTKIDANVRTRLGNLPTNVRSLEDERVISLKTVLAASTSQPQIVTEGMVSEFLTNQHVGSVAELLTKNSGTLHNNLTITFEEVSSGASVTRPLPVRVALRIMETLPPLRDLVAEAKFIQSAISSSSPFRGDIETPPTHPVTVGIICPESLFSDSDWPSTSGTPRNGLISNRISLASIWLAAEGIALITVT